MEQKHGNRRQRGGESVYPVSCLGESMLWISAVKRKRGSHVFGYAAVAQELYHLLRLRAVHLPPNSPSHSQWCCYAGPRCGQTATICREQHPVSLLAGLFRVDADERAVYVYHLAAERGSLSPQACKVVLILSPRYNSAQCCSLTCVKWHSRLMSCFAPKPNSASRFYHQILTLQKIISDP